MRAGDHLLDMINDIMGFSRIDGGQLAVEMRRVALAPVIDEAIALMAHGARLASVTVHNELDASGEVAVCADPLRLRQVLVNLLSNGIKNSRAGGSVRFRATHDADAVVLRVADDGRGMDALQLGQLFEPFNRPGQDRLAVEGTGLGLVISKRLTEMMGGRVEVASVPGRGSSFALKLLPVDAQPMALSA